MPRKSADAGIHVQASASAAPLEKPYAHYRRKIVTAIRLQRAAIIRHRAHLVRRLGRAVSLDEAARDWIPNHAADWRSDFASHSDSKAEGMCPPESPAGRS